MGGRAAEEILLDLPLEIAALEEILHQPILQRVVGNHHQATSRAEHLQALLEGHLQRLHLAIHLDAQGLKQFGQEF